MAAIKYTKRQCKEALQAAGDQLGIPRPSDSQNQGERQYMTEILSALLQNRDQSRTDHHAVLRVLAEGYVTSHVRPAIIEEVAKTISSEVLTPNLAKKLKICANLSLERYNVVRECLHDAMQHAFEKLGIQLLTYVHDISRQRLVANINEPRSKPKKHKRRKRRSRKQLGLASDDDMENPPNKRKKIPNTPTQSEQSGT